MSGTSRRNRFGSRLDRLNLMFQQHLFDRHNTLWINPSFFVAVIVHSALYIVCCPETIVI